MPERKPNDFGLPDSVKASTIRHAKPITGTDSEIDHEPNRFRRFFKLLGPGLITGASDDDPSGIGTYSIAGAALGFATLWTAIITLPLLAHSTFV